MTTKPLTAKQVADRLDYSSETIYDYARRGLLPAPIDTTLPSRMWRWSPTVIERYEAGEWRSHPARIVRAS